MEALAERARRYTSVVDPRPRWSPSRLAEQASHAVAQVTGWSPRLGSGSGGGSRSGGGGGKRGFSPSRTQRELTAAAEQSTEATQTLVPPPDDAATADGDGEVVVLEVVRTPGGRVVRWM